MFICYFLIFLISPSLAFECGLQGDSLRIVGGTKTGKNQYPWIMRMTVVWDNGMGSLCGASLINRQWAVSAAHCFHPPEAGAKMLFVKLMAGEYKTNKDEGTEEILFADTVVRHKGFNRTSMDDDIAAIKLDRKLDFKGRDRHLMPICLHKNALDKVNKDNCTAAGWGTTVEGGKHQSKVLKHVTLPIDPDSYCHKIWRQYYNPSMKLCAGGTADQDSCQGDSGGPLQCPMANGAWVLVGITSFGGECGKDKQPGVYTRVEKYIDWIEEKKKEA